MTGYRNESAHACPRCYGPFKESKRLETASSQHNSKHLQTRSTMGVPGSRGKSVATRMLSRDWPRAILPLGCNQLGKPETSRAQDAMRPFGTLLQGRHTRPQHTPREASEVMCNAERHRRAYEVREHNGRSNGQIQTPRKSAIQSSGEHAACAHLLQSCHEVEHQRLRVMVAPSVRAQQIIVDGVGVRCVSLDGRQLLVAQSEWHRSA